MKLGFNAGGHLTVLSKFKKFYETYLLAVKITKEQFDSERKIQICEFSN